MRDKIQHLLEQMNTGLVEREAIFKSALLAVLAGENTLLVGPPGTAKSLIARRIASGLPRDKNGSDYFEYLLTKFSTPEEIFGPLSIAELKADRYKRNTAAYLPTAKIAFLDEIFKASSSILNALLTILNERVYHNGAEPQSVPLQSLIAASNELPTDQEELSALYDRFLVRSFVDYVSEGAIHKLFDNTELSDPQPLGLDNLNQAQAAARAVEIPQDIRTAIQTIWVKHKALFKEDAREGLSDRRLKKIQNLLRMSAASNGRTEVDLSDVFLLKDCLWNHPDNAEKVRDLILKTLVTFSRAVPQTEPLALAHTHDEIITYEVAADGKTLVPATAKNSALIVKTSSAMPVKSTQKAAPKGSVIKGWLGSGTQNDPLQVACIDDLTDIAETHIGLQGYYFIQTADIDGSHIATWPTIAFNGHYNGQGLSITAPEKVTVFSTAEIASFERINLQSSSHLTGKTLDCTFAACQSGGRFVSSSSVTNCTFTDYVAGAHLVSSSSSVTNCTFTDCVAGAHLVSSRSVKNCAITNGWADQECISPSNLGGNTIKNFVQLESRRVTDAQGNEKIIDAAQWKQRYFENTLKWDFAHLWEWNAADNCPILRISTGSTKTKHAAPSDTLQADTVDLLTQQIRANIWL